MAFDTIVDWEYFSQEDDEKNIVQPNPLDPSQPRRTRESSGSVIRIFRGELSGRVASMMRSQGKEYRILLKEFSGEMAVELAEAEFRCIGKLQSDLCALKSGEAKNGDWANTASSRYLLAQDEKADTKEDDNNLIKLMDILNSRKESAPFVGILGRLNIDDLDLEPNEWYKALGKFKLLSKVRRLYSEISNSDAHTWTIQHKTNSIGVPPPKFNSVWIVYEYAGLGTPSQYSQPPLFRRSRLVSFYIFSTVVRRFYNTQTNFKKFFFLCCCNKAAPKGFLWPNSTSATTTVEVNCQLCRERNHEEIIGSISRAS